MLQYFPPSVAPSMLPGNKPSNITPSVPYPVIKSDLNLNTFKLYTKNPFNVDISTIGISSFTKPNIITISGDIFFPYDMNNPPTPYFYCNETGMFPITDISVTDNIFQLQNIYYIKLSINQSNLTLSNLKTKTNIIKLTNIRIYLSQPTNDMIKNPTNAILFFDQTYIPDKPTVYPTLATPFPSFVSKYDLYFKEKNIILSETFTGFDIFAQFNLCKITDIGSNPTDIYKSIYVNSNNPIINNYYYATIWADRLVTPMLSTNSTVSSINQELLNAKFYNFTDNIQILAQPYKYSFIHYQYKFETHVLLNILTNGFNPTIDNYNSLLDYDNKTIISMKYSRLPKTELTFTDIYVGCLYCNSSIFDTLLSQINTWPRNSFDCNIAFYSYVTYKMYLLLSDASSSLTSNVFNNTSIRLYKITTPFRKNSPFVYRIGINSFLPYLTNPIFISKLTNYSTVSISIDLPTAMLIAYYDKNPQSTNDANAKLTPQELITSYYSKESVLNNVSIPVVLPSNTLV